MPSKATEINETVNAPEQLEATTEPLNTSQVHSEGTQDAEAQAKQYIYFKESSGNQYAINKSSGACGLGQALPCSKLPCELSDYNCQDVWFTNYMKNRYGSWTNAMQFHKVNGWW